MVALITLGMPNSKSNVLSLPFSNHHSRLALDISFLNQFIVPMQKRKKDKYNKNNKLN
jgi:hypothetical protein